MTVQEALSNFYEINGFDSLGGANQKIAYLKVSGVNVPIYNFKHRREQIWKHDLNHLLTGYKTDWKGETAVCGWEVATGGYGFNLFWLLIISGFMIGVLVYPTVTFRAFVRGHFSKPHASVGVSRDELLKMNLKELRAILGLSESDYKAKPIHRVKFLAIILLFFGTTIASIYAAFLIVLNFILL